MEKLIYLTRRKPELDAGAYRRHLLEEAAPRLLAAGVRRLDVNVSDLLDTIPKPMLLMGEGGSLSAALSLWLDCYDARGPVEAVLRSRAAHLDGYLVTESVPQPCTDRDWPDGARSPGVTHFTWFEKPAAIPDDEFFRAWHEVHTPFSFELHPRRWSYVRNSVTRTLTPGSPPIRAIVAERFRTLEDYTDPKRLFGSTEALQRSAAEVAHYADPSRLHSVPLSEFILRS
jgi:EthD domain